MTVNIETYRRNHATKANTSSLTQLGNKLYKAVTKNRRRKKAQLDARRTRTFNVWLNDCNLKY